MCRTKYLEIQENNKYSYKIIERESISKTYLGISFEDGPSLKWFPTLFLFTMIVLKSWAFTFQNMVSGFWPLYELERMACSALYF